MPASSASAVEKTAEETSTMPIQVWLIEDHRDFRATIMRVLAREPDFELTPFSSCEEALTRLATGALAQVILLDIGLPGMSGLEGITRLKSLSPATQIIMLTAFDDRRKIRAAIEAGAAGYLLKTSRATQISQNIREVLGGGAALDSHIARCVLDMMRPVRPAAKSYGLAPRELEVLEALVAGKSVKQIAADLGVSYHTVDTYLRRIYQKMDVQTRSLAVAKALRDRVL